MDYTSKTNFVNEDATSNDIKNSDGKKEIIEDDSNKDQKKVEKVTKMQAFIRGHQARKDGKKK